MNDLTYKGIEVEVSGYGQFVFQLDGDHHHVDTYKEAKEKIDAYQTVKAKTSAAKNLRVELLDGRGKVETVTGLHASRGVLLGIEHHDRPHYPKHPYIAKLIERENAAEQAWRDLGNELHKFRVISPSFSFRDQRSVETLIRMAERFEQNVAEKIALADKAAAEEAPE